jgi:7-carboxy-7-deazaguanine synthase
MEHIFNISEIFYSIQGEGTRSGLPCVFVRLQGCNLNCSWCDTEYAINPDETPLKLTGKQIIEEIQKYKCNFVEFTGGEPLIQREIVEIMGFLCDNGYTVALETNGSILLDFIDARVIKILDVKCPSSNMSGYINFKNFDFIKESDEIKFVISDRKDFDYACEIIRKYDLSGKAHILFSPVFHEIEFKELAQWLLKSGLSARLQLQLHKIIWGDIERGFNH